MDKVKVPKEDTAETFLGSLVHEALERLYRDLQYEKLLTLDELVGHFNAEWGKKWNDKIVLVKQQYTPENYRKMGEKYIKDYYVRYKPFDQGRVIGIETQKFLSLDEKGSYKYHVRIDRLVDKGAGIYEVHDYKTSRSLPTREELEQDRQLSMYALWVRQEFDDLKEVRLVWHFLAFDKEMESFRDLEQLEQIRQDTLKKIQEIEEAAEYPASVSRLCDWCLYQEICPMWRHEVELEVKPENEYLNDPGLKLVDEYVRLKEELDAHKMEAAEKLEKLKQALVTFCEKNQVSAVAGTEKKAVVTPYKTWKLPEKNSDQRARMLEVLKELGRSEEVMGFDTHALVKVLQEKKWEDDELEIIKEFVHQEISYRVNISKRKEE